MPPVTATARRRAVTRLDPIAAGWGGLTVAIGLLAGSPRDLAQRIAIVCVLSLVGGFLAGVRAIGRRTAHAVAAWTVGVGMFAAFVLATALVDLFGGPHHARIAPDGLGRSGVVLGLSLVAALGGGTLASSWLRPGGQAGRYS